MASNEVFVGANAQVGMSPELDLYFQDAVLSSSTTLTLSSGQQTLVHLVPDLYIGCTVKIGALASNDATSYRTIVDNTATTIVIDSAPVDSNGSAVTSGTMDATILSFGAPLYASRDGGTNPRIHSDSWLGTSTISTRERRQ